MIYSIIVIRNKNIYTIQPQEHYDRILQAFKPFTALRQISRVLTQGGSPTFKSYGRMDLRWTSYPLLRWKVGVPSRQIVQIARLLSSASYMRRQISSAVSVRVKCTGEALGRSASLTPPICNMMSNCSLPPHYFYCPHCNKYAVVRLEPVHPRRGMTLRLMGHISRLMREVSAKLLSGVLRLSESSILRVDKDILTPRAATITLQASPAVLIFLGGVKIE